MFRRGGFVSRIALLLAALTAVALASPLAPGTGRCSAPVLCPPWLGPILERAVEPIDGLMLPADLLELATAP
jgi:hypothetical protein